MKHIARRHSPDDSRDIDDLIYCDADTRPSER